jgi:hypothetical protein
VKKISSIGTEAGSSYVNVEGTPVWWNYDGIWTLAEGGIQSLTNETIKTFIKETIPGISRKYVQGAFNPLQQTVQWLWKSTSPTDVADAYRYDRILEFNLQTKAFYPHSWDVADQAFSTIFCASDITATVVTNETVVDEAGDDVTNAALELVTSSVISNVEYTSSEFKYFATNV